MMSVIYSILLCSLYTELMSTQGAWLINGVACKRKHTGSVISEILLTELYYLMHETKLRQLK